MRDLRIDVFRGLLILLVVLGHTDDLPKSLLNIIYSFHMPSFFILSGFLFSINSAETIHSRIALKFRRLIIPAWVLGLLCGIPFAIGLFIYRDHLAIVAFANKLVGTLIGYPTWTNTFNCTPIWFLFSLFMAEMIAIILTSKIRSVSVLFIVGVIGVSLSLYVKSYTFFNVAISLSGLLFFAVGVTVRRYCDLEKVIGVAPAGTALLVFLLIRIYAPENVNMATNTIGKDALGVLLSVLCAISGCVLAFNISSVISKIKIINSKFSWLGVNTLAIIAFDYYANNIVASLHYYFGVRAHYETNFIIKVIILSFIAYLISSIKHLDSIVNARKVK